MVRAEQDWEMCGGPYGAWATNQPATETSVEALSVKHLPRHARPHTPMGPLHRRVLQLQQFPSSTLEE